MSGENESQLLQLFNQMNEKIMEIKELQFTIQQNQEQKNSELSKQIFDLTENLRPVIELYGQFKGFGSIGSLVMKFIVIPASVVIGLLLSFRSLLMPHN